MTFFETLPSYRIPEAEGADTLARLAARVTERTGLPITCLDETGIGTISTDRPTIWNDFLRYTGRSRSPGMISM